MSNTVASYQWSFGPIICNPVYNGHFNVVAQIHWQLTGTDINFPQYKDTYRGISNIPFVESDGFIPYENLTLNNMRDWILEQLVLDSTSLLSNSSIVYTPEIIENNIKTAILNSIDFIKYPSMVTLHTPF